MSQGSSRTLVDRALDVVVASRRYFVAAMRTELQHWLCLPAALVHRVMARARAQDVRRMEALLSSAAGEDADVLQNGAVWRHLLVRDFGEDALDVEFPPGCSTWRARYRAIENADARALETVAADAKRMYADEEARRRQRVIRVVDPPPSRSRRRGGRRQGRRRTSPLKSPSSQSPVLNKLRRQAQAERRQRDKAGLRRRMALARARNAESPRGTKRSRGTVFLDDLPLPRKRR